ncbi:MAG: hypothetical protein IK066_03565 [Kiritimatiellae bacterium]|nr:hypothetical protein [Kiritimatiellia bacterium]
MPRILRHWPILLLALWFGGMTVALDRAVALFSARTTPAPPDLSAPAPWRNSRLFVDPDSYAWLSYARDLRESPHFRVRFTHMDNAPFGRPVHWAQLPIWSLCGIAAVLETVGIPSPSSLELAGRILLPLLGFLAFSALWLFLRRRIPPGIAGLAALSLAVTLFWDFHPLRPDHHGFHLAAAAAFVLPLLFSSFGLAPPSPRNRLPFLSSGIFGGIAFWLGATVFYFTFSVTALAVALALLPRSTAAAPRQDPTVWRLWGLAGFSTSIFFWLLEYAPNHFSMRLEANHPLYALSFLGVGECLHLLSRLRHNPATRLSPTFCLHAFLALLAAAALPCIVLFGPVSWYIPRSPLMLRLHSRHIAEFLSLRVYCGLSSQSFWRHLVRPVLPALAALPFLPRPLSRRHLFALPFLGLFLALYLWQNRWESFVVLASCFLVAAVAPTVGAPPSCPGLRRRLFRLAVPAALLLQIAWMARGHLAMALSRDTFVWHREFQSQALALQFACALAAPSVTPTPNASSPVVLAPGELAPCLYYYARIPSVSSLYWENLDGNLDAVAAFGDPVPDAPDALAVVARRRVSHLFMVESLRDPLLFDHLRTGVFSPPHAARTLAGTLAGARPDAPLPPWLAVDTALNRLANPVLFTFLPARAGFAPFRYPLRIYSLMPSPAPCPVLGLSCPPSPANLASP